MLHKIKLRVNSFTKYILPKNSAELLTGFTLIEVIVSVAIIILMVAITMVKYGDLRNRSTLNQAAQKVALDIRKAQNLAASTVAQSDGSVFCGYGIHYSDLNTYILFTDKDSSGDPLCGPADQIFNLGEETETINIEQPNIKFENSFSDILFFPPDPVTYIGGSFNPSFTSVIILCVETDCDSSFKKINVWGNGRIDIE